MRETKGLPMTEAARSFESQGYQKHAAFVPALGAVVLDWLDPREGERILDVGAGDGVLTRRLVERGARVVGVDASPGMVDAARALGLDVRLGDAADLPFDAEFHAVFSNATLHWVHPPEAAARSVYRALLPGGRFVGEFGGHGCCAAIRTALTVALEQAGVPAEGADPWFFPTAAHYRGVLERAGFVVDEIVQIGRPTPLPTGFGGWLETFGKSWLERVPAASRAAVLAHAERLLARTLVDEQGVAIADYVRIRFRARRPGDAA